jgi:hypothetical protein
MQLPPSLGDHMITSDGKVLLDDMASQMSEILYKIRVSVLNRPLGETSQILSSVARTVHIIPAVLEQAPLEPIYNWTDEYCGRVEKEVRMGLLKQRWAVSSWKPRNPPLRLSVPGEEDDHAIGTLVTLHVRFDPDADESPPRLKTVRGKVKATTYFSTWPWDTLPSKNLSIVGDSSKDLYTETITGMITVYSANTFYTASITVPITLPKTKEFVPTFHSCYISRVYLLELGLSYQMPNARVFASNISLEIPVQVTSSHRKYGISADVSADPELSQMQTEESF